MLGRNLLLVALWTSGSVFGGLCAAPLALAAPPAIPISDSLVVNADPASFHGKPIVRAIAAAYR
jgi:hypothetical protein